jgi:nucleotide-binding universal stress UspA family protein
VTKTIIVPLDGSEFAERALAPAAALAERTGADVILMTSQMGGVVVEPKRYLTDAAVKAGIPGANVAVITDHFAASGLKIVVADAQDPIVCMSTHGHSGVIQALVGSTAEDAVRLLRVPMLLLGPNVELSLATRLDSVVVCTDGTETSKAIVPEVSEWIGDLRLRAWVVEVLDPEVRRALEESGVEPAMEVATVHAFAESLLTRDGAGINWDVLHSDHAARAIVDYACQVRASLIAMSTHGRTGLARVALGSVTALVVHNAPCPVLVVRPDGLSDRDEPDGETTGA